MEKALYPSKYIRITQKDHVGTHADSWAIDEAGSDSGIDYLVAPFTGMIKKIYTQDANEVWLESIAPIEFADGTVDYMTIMFVHDNNVSNLCVGQIIKQGERFYEEGTKGNASGNHVHFECARGKFTGTGWHKNSAGYWSINNGKKVDECLFINESHILMNTNGYNLKKAEKHKIGYKTHVQNIGWQEWVYDGATAGTTGKGLQLEAIRIDYDEDIYAKAHIQDIGWVDYDKINSNTIIGTIGESKRLECLCLKGNFKYRAHLQGTSWTPWTKADGIATLGTVGQALRIEAIEIVEL